MTRHNMTQTTLGRRLPRVPGTFLGRPLERLLALFLEWRTRRNIERSLGQLSSFYLRDVGLTKSDLEAAWADSLDRPLSLAIESAAQNRMGNW
jgi:uncharacterized protein YjiS (DUF1127 family)